MKLSRLCTRLLLAAICLATGAQADGQNTQGRMLKICVASDAPPEVKKSAERILAGAASSALLRQLGVNGIAVENSKALLADKIEARAYHHLIFVGLPSDPLIQAAWQHEAKVEEDGFYIFGFGHLHGTLGYIESSRNPFLHSEAVLDAPYETEVITITGSSLAGIDLAVDAFLKDGLINGVVAAAGWTRAGTTLLDRAPLVLPLDALPEAPESAGNAVRIGVSQAGENEYRDELQDTGMIPKSIWRVKYYDPQEWGPAAKQERSSVSDYLVGLDRRAFGETLWIAQFATAGDAAEAAGKIASSVHLQKQGSKWKGAEPFGKMPANGIPSRNQSAAPLVLWIAGDKVLMSDVPGLSN